MKPLFGEDGKPDWINHSVVFHSTNKPPGAPLLSDSSLWYNEVNDTFYSGFTGRSSFFGDSPEPPPISVWSFKPDGLGSGSWKVEISADDPKWTRRTRTDKAYTAFGGGSALVLGGVLNPWTVPESTNVTEDIQVPGIVEFNMTRKGFFNSSATGFNAKGTGKSGAMHYVPSFGPNGLFVIMGGTDHKNDDNNIGFDNIWVYETLENRWYNQTATGNIPAGRRDFCLAGINSTNETYEIFLYGGFNGRLGPATVPYDEIFILTLPAFHWLKVDYPPQHPRHGHSCNAIGGSQIVSIGGVDSNAKVTFGNVKDVRQSCFNSSVDPLVQGLGVFDMTTLTWADRYVANAPSYEQSALVRSYYRDNHFSQPPSSTSGPSTLPLPPSSSSSSIGAIASAVVGSVIGLALTSGIATIIYRRRRTRQLQPKSKWSQGYVSELQGNEQQIQEADDDTYDPAKTVQEIQGVRTQQQGPAEMEVERPEMDYPGAPSRPIEMDATGVRR
ncbi:MAG: hypothetical protein Q9213_001762 [Squamulea squamosa]